MQMIGELFKKREEHRTGQQIIKDEPVADPFEDCFIATAVYGTPQNKEINILRAYRDDELRNNIWGRIFIAGYERFGPMAAFYIRQKEERKAWARKHIVEPALDFVNDKNNEK